MTDLFPFTFTMFYISHFTGCIGGFVDLRKYVRQTKEGSRRRKEGYKDVQRHRK